MKRLGYRLLVVAIVLLFAFLSARLKPPTRQTTLAPTTPSTQSPESQSPESQSPESQSPESQSPESQSPEPQSPEPQRAETESTGKGDSPSTKSRSKKSPSTSPQSKSQSKSTSPATSPSSAPASFVVRDVSIKDLDGDTAFRGDIDLTATIERVDAGRKLTFSNDGSTFQNRERRLPNRPAGYYREWVHPTPGLRGPGPQRLVTGENGEVWYTPDHYRSFRKLR